MFRRKFWVKQWHHLVSFCWTWVTIQQQEQEQQQQEQQSGYKSRASTSCLRLKILEFSNRPSFQSFSRAVYFTIFLEDILVDPMTFVDPLVVIPGYAWWRLVTPVALHPVHLSHSLLHNGLPFLFLFLFLFKFKVPLEVW
jgi:hypothetical protein